MYEECAHSPDSATPDNSEPQYRRHSKKEINWSIGFLVQHGLLPDTRKCDVAKTKKRAEQKQKNALRREKRRAKEEQQKAAKKAKKLTEREAQMEQIQPFVVVGWSEGNIAKKFNIPKSRVHTFKMEIKKRMNQD